MSAADLFRDLQKLEVDAHIDLWTVDNSVNGGSTYRFHSSNKTGTTEDIVFNSITYVATPMQVRGIEQSGSSKPKPKLTIATATALALDLLSDPDLLLGATCTRIRTLAKYLDGQPDADPTSVYPTAKFFVEALDSSDSDVATTYRLSEPSDLPNTSIPRRTINANLCGVLYRGGSCAYAGDPKTDDTGTAFVGPFVDRGTWSSATSNYVAKDYVSINNPDGVPFVWVALQAVPAGVRPGSSGSSSYWSIDRCLKRIADCKLRFNHLTVGLPFGGFPGATQIPQ